MSNKDKIEMLSYNEKIEKIQQLTPENLIPQVKFHSFLHLLCTFVYGHTRRESMMLSCTEFQKAVHKFYANKNYAHETKQLHVLLAAYYATICDPKNDKTWIGFSASAFRSLLYHLFHGVCFEEIADVLCSLHFIEAVAAVQALNDLLEYYNLLIGEIGKQVSKLYKNINISKLHSYHNFVSKNLHILQRLPHMVMQQALNEPLESLVDVTEITESKISTIECLSRPSIADFRILTLDFIKNITSVAYQKSKPCALLGTEDGYLKVLDVFSKKVIHTLKTHFSAITFIHCVGKNRICTSSRDNTLSLFDSGNYIRIAVLIGHKDSVTSCCSDPPGSILWSSGLDNSIRLWSLSDGRAISVIDKFNSPVNYVAHHPIKQQIACALWNGNIEIWDTLSLKKNLVIPGFSGSVKCATYVPSGINIISATIHSEVFIYSSENGLKIARLNASYLPIHSICCSETENFFVTAGEDCRLQVWPTELKTSLATFYECKFCPISFLEIFQLSNLAVAFQNRDVWVMDINNGHVIFKFDTKSDPVTCFSKFHSLEIGNQISLLISAGESLIFGTESGKIKVADFETSSISVIASLNAKITVAIHTNDLILCGSTSGDICVISYSDNITLQTIGGAHEGSITALNFSSINDCVFALSAATDKIMKLWEITHNVEIEISFCELYSSQHKDCITCCYLIPKTSSEEESHHIITGSHDNNIVLSKNNTTTVFQGLQTTVVDVHYSGSFILGCGRDGSIIIWSHDGTIMSNIAGVQQSSVALSFSVIKGTDDTFDVTIAFVDNDGSVIIKTPFQTSHLCTLEGHGKAITSCSVDNFGEVVSSSLDGSVNMWRLPDNINNQPYDSSVAITSVSFSMKNNLVLSSDVNGNIVLWKVQTLSKVSSLMYVTKKTYPQGFVRQVLWTKEDKLIAAVNAVSENKDKYYLDMFNCAHILSKDNPIYVLRQTNSHFFESEILCIDYSEKSDTIVVGLKSWNFVIISSEFKKYFRSEDWILSAKLVCSMNSEDVVYISLPCGMIQCFSMSDIVKYKEKDIRPKVVYRSLKTEKLNQFPKSLCCDADGKVYSGNNNGWLSIYSPDSTCTTKEIHTNAITGICILGTNLFTSSLDKTVKGWNINSLKQVCQFHSSVPITCLTAPRHSTSLTTNFLVMGTTAGTVHLLKFNHE